MKKEIFIILILLLVLIMGIVYFVEDKADYSDSLSKPPIFKEDSQEMFNLDDVKNISRGDIIGTWKILEEGFKDGKSVEEFSEIIFNEDNAYSSEDLFLKSGMYEIKDSKIYFYDSNSEIDGESYFLYADAGFEGEKLKLVIPKIPKAMILEKVR